MTTNKVLSGIASSPGICIGKAYVVEKKISVFKKILIKNVKEEIKRFERAIVRTAEQLHQASNQTPDESKQHAAIVDTYTVLLKDELLYGKTIKIIKKKYIAAEWALQRAVSEIKSTFRTIKNDYFRTRVYDIIHVSNLVLENLLGKKRTNLKKISEPVIVVAKNLSPAETIQIKAEYIKGFITTRGGYSSHTSIIARSLEIPAIFGVANATMNIKNDDILTLDGTVGKVLINPSDKMLEEVKKRIQTYSLQKTANITQGQLSATTKDGATFSVMGNIGFPEEISSIVNYGGDGIGLYRTEFQYLVKNKFPSEKDLFAVYKNIVDNAQGFPVTIRTLDISEIKTLECSENGYKANPALGLRAIRYCLKKTDVFQTQLKAILRAAFYGSVKILIPMISSIEEIHKTKKLINESIQILKTNKKPCKNNVPIGIMIEVPSAAITADILADSIDFFSIGTNDLIQYTMAIDRSNEHVATLYQPLNPAILRMISHVCNISKKRGIKISMCGEMASNPFYIPILLGLGIDEFSMNPQSIPAVKKTIRSLKIDDVKKFAADAMKLSTSKEIENFIYKKYKNIISN